jgi:hypothetical protein
MAASFNYGLSTCVAKPRPTAGIPQMPMIDPLHNNSAWTRGFV